MSEFTPVLYLKAGCPHCFRLRLFLLESGQLGHFETREFQPDANDPAETAIRAELAPHLAKVTFPTVQYAPGQYQNESNDLIARYSAGIDAATLPVFSTWANVLQPKQNRLNAENKALRAALAAGGLPLPEGLSPT
jgi:hypothetical protein